MKHTYKILFGLALAGLLTACGDNKAEMDKMRQENAAKIAELEVKVKAAEAKAEEARKKAFEAQATSAANAAAANATN